MSLLLSPIQMLDIQLLHSCFEIALPFEEGDEQNRVSFQFNASDITEDDDAMHMEADLVASLASEEAAGKGPSLKVHVRGLFQGNYFEDAATFEEFETFMKVNAFSLLYGYVRSHVQNTTCMMPCGKISLPCIDMGSIADDISEDSYVENE